VLDPLVTRSVERVVEPDRIRFVPSVASQAGTASWALTIERGGAVVHTERGSSAPPGAFDWAFAEELEGMQLSGDPLRYTLRVVDAVGQERTSTGAIEVQEITVRRKRENRIADRAINRFHLILFDYDSPQLGRRNERILGTYVQPEIGPGSTVRITGHTDRIGEAEYNRALSMQRARNAARVLRVSDEQAVGKGEEDPPNDNALPEGRFYNRTVEVVVETPR
jgi:outer membrane protein OmpA-like peptidoglycan-associated protein